MSSIEEIHTRLQRIEELAAERVADERLYPHQRNRNQTFSDVLAYLIGLEAFSDEHLDAAIAFVRSHDAKVIQLRSAV